MKMHGSVTLARVMEAVERAQKTLAHPGFCIHCGGEAEDVEPDARAYTCESCSENGVFGAEELLIRLF